MKKNKKNNFYFDFTFFNFIIFVFHLICIPFCTECINILCSRYYVYTIIRMFRFVYYVITFFSVSFGMFTILSLTKLLNYTNQLSEYVWVLCLSGRPEERKISKIRTTKMTAAATIFSNINIYTYTIHCTHH